MRNYRFILLFITVSSVLFSLLPTVGLKQAVAAKAEEKKAIVEKNTLHYPLDAPQLANLRIEATIEVPKPILQPLNGRITYDENYTARISSSIAGKVAKLSAQIGDHVRAGQPLLWLDSPDFLSAVADVRKAENDLRQKELAFSRAKTLYEGQVLARKDYESAETDLRQSRTELERVKARLRILNPTGAKIDASERFALRSPIDGVITERQVNPGTEVRPDAPNPLFVITDSTHLWVVIDLEEQHLSKIRPKQAVTLEVDAYPGETFPSQVLSIGETLDPTTRRVQVRCALSNPERRLKPEMYARVTPFTNDNAKVIRVPNAALLTEGLYSFAFVEIQPGTIEKRKVVLEMQGREFSFVKEGLKAGERIVTTGALLLNSELASSGG